MSTLPFNNCEYHKIFSKNSSGPVIYYAVDKLPGLSFAYNNLIESRSIDVARKKATGLPHRYEVECI